jgi:transposase
MCSWVRYAERVIDEVAIRTRYEALSATLDERARRLLLGAEARAAGRGGQAAVARATGAAPATIRRGLAELSEDTPARGRVRRPGGGRKRTVDRDPTLLTDLEALIEPGTRGDPESALRWTTKSVRRLAAELGRAGHRVSHRLVGELLHELGYSLQANRKTLEGTKHPDRNAQFEHLNGAVQLQLALGEPVISVDTKKKELVGPFANRGRELRPMGDPRSVLLHDFVIPELGRASPYGVYDLAENTGWVSVGTDHDTAAFAVETIRRWWTTMGRERYPDATRLLVTADAGGSNGYRLRLWKWELQRLADEIGLAISVCHFPPGTSKWNKIEHRLFSAISANWRGTPLVSHEVIVNLIAATTTTKGLRIRSELDTHAYPTGVSVSDADMTTLYLERDAFHGEWNYTLRPRLTLPSE